MPLRFKTRNTLYTLDDEGDGAFLIMGHPRYCPTPTLCTLHWPVEVGKRVKFDIAAGPLKGETITTTEVREVHE